MLVCKCGWRGVNLAPHTEDDTARCPICDTVFQGIPADRAVAVSDDEELRIAYEADVLEAMGHALSEDRFK